MQHVLFAHIPEVNSILQQQFIDLRSQQNK